MIIGIYLESYHQGGLDRMIIDLINHWPNLQDQFVIFGNDLHEGLNSLKKWIKKNTRFVIYKTSFSMRCWIRLSKNPTLLFQLNRLFYNIIGSYLAMLWQVPKIIRLWKKEKIEAVMIHNGGWPGARSTRSAAIAAFILKLKKRFLVIHSLVYKPSWVIRIQESILEHLLSLTKIKIVTVSEAAKQNLKKNTRLPEAQVIYNGIRDLTPEKDTGEKISSIHEKLGLSPNTFLMGMFGTLDAYRGHSYMLEVMKLLIQEIPHAALLILGTGSTAQKEAIKKIIESEKLEKHVYLLGFQNYSIQIMQKLDIIVNPVLSHESFGLVGVEAMALKKPVIANQVGGLPEIIEDGVTGFLVSPNDHKTFTKRLVQLAKNIHLRHQMGELGYQRYQHFFKADQMSLKYQALFHH